MSIPRKRGAYRSRRECQDLYDVAQLGSNRVVWNERQRQFYDRVKQAGLPSGRLKTTTGVLPSSLLPQKAR